MTAAKGSVILLVGPSCAGKTTLTKALQALSPEPYLAQSLDGLFAATPQAWGGSGQHTLEGFSYDWSAPTAEDGSAVRRIACGPVGWRLLQGWRRAVAAYAEAGTNVIVDDMLLSLEALADWADALAAVPTLLVKVTAPKAELLRREAARRIHATPGLVLGHFDLHESVVADAEIDTSRVTPEEGARALSELAASQGAALRRYRPA